MSGLYENLPFLRGSTYGAADNTLATQYEGKEFIIQDDQFGTGLNVHLRICRNNSGAALLPKRAVKFNLTAGKGQTDVAGYCTVRSEATGIVDDRLASTGVPSGDLFYVITKGPCLARTGLAADATNSIAVGDLLGALTAATTGATTAGRVGAIDLSGATAVLIGAAFAAVGRAMSAKTTANTNVDLLVNANIGRF